MDKIIDSFNTLVKHPFWLFAFIVSALVFGYMQYVKPELIKAQSAKDESILQISKEQARLKAELSLLRAAKAAELEEVAKGFLNSQPLEAWATYYDPESETFKFLAVNDFYAEKYGTSFIVFGKTVKEAYSVRTDMSPEEIALLDAYNVNNERALALSNKCIVFSEWVIPLNKQPVKQKFRKCGMRSGTILVVYGEREL